MTRYCRHCRKNVTVSVDKFTRAEICSICGSSLIESALPTGTIISGFQIEEEIGRNPLGIIYRARQLNLERYVALRVLSESLSEDIDFVEKFFHEARAAAGINHANIVYVYEAGSTAEGLYYVAVELFPGETLASRIAREGRLKSDLALDIAHKVADALGFVWNRKQIFHGDITPDKIILNSSGEIKLADMGLSRFVKELTGAGASFKYASPEFLKGAAEGPASDIYSFGATLYCMLLGAPPFNENDPQKVNYCHLHLKPTPLHDRSPETDPELSEFVSSMLEKLPEKRPEGWDKIRAFIEEYLLKKGKVVKSDSYYVYTEPKDSKRRGGGKMLALAVSLGVVALLLGGAVFHFISGPRGGGGAPKAASSSGMSQAAVMEEWKKLKVKIQFMTPARSVEEINAFVERHSHVKIPDADTLVGELREKEDKERKLSQDKEAFAGDLLKLEQALEAIDIDSMSMEKLKKIADEIKNINRRAEEYKISESVYDMEKKSKIEIAAARITAEMDSKKKEADLKKRQEQERLEAERKLAEKKAGEEKEAERKRKAAADSFSKEFGARLAEYINDKKRIPQNLASSVDSWLKERGELFSEKNIGRDRKKAELVARVFLSALPAPALIQENADKLVGKQLPLKELSPEYKLESHDSENLRLSMTDGKATINKKVKYSSLSKGECRDIIKGCLCAQEVVSGLSKRHVESIIVFFITAKRFDDAEQILSGSQAIPKPEADIWAELIGLFKSLSSE